MEIREYQLDKLDEARALQQQCLNLHLPSPPVLHWEYKVSDGNGNIVSAGRGKANSYTRNALNILALNLGYPEASHISSSYFQDGYVSIKDVSGTVYSNASKMCAISDGYAIVLGYGSATESLDSYKLAIQIEGYMGWTIGAQSRTTAFNSTSRKLITTLTRAFTNSTGGSVGVTEAGMYGQLYVNSSQYYAITVYDVFDAIAVADGATITWTYTTEIAYPTP